MRWIEITSAPKDGRDVLVCEEGRPGVTMVSWKGGKKNGSWHTEDGVASYGEGIFTHWMPIPLAVGERPDLRIVPHPKRK